MIFMNYKVCVVECIPKEIFLKENNESFIRKMLTKSIGEGVWVRGDPNLREPDFFWNDVPFEFTLASDQRKKNNFVRKMIEHHYISDDAERDLLDYCMVRIEEKAKKNYSVDHVHLCILCLIDMTFWVSDHYGSSFHELYQYRKEEFRTSVRKEYIEKGIFENVFLIFPDIFGSWWICDCLTDYKTQVKLSDKNIRDGKIPYMLVEEEYLRIMNGINS